MVFSQQPPQNLEGEYLVSVLVKRAHDAPHVDPFEPGFERDGAGHAGLEDVDFSAARAEFQRQAKVGAADLLNGHVRTLRRVYRVHHVGQGGAIRSVGFKVRVERAIHLGRETTGRLVQIHGFLFHIALSGNKRAKGWGDNQGGERPVRAGRSPLIGERPVVFRKVAGCFEQLHTVEAGRLEARGDFVPKSDDEVFRRGNDPA